MTSLEVKWFLSAQSSADLAPEDFVPIFHEWIRADRLPDETLIDVADYSHLKEGPGVVLVAHRSAYGIDSVGGGLGLTYRDGSKAPRLEDTFVRALRACQALENEGFHFRTDEVRIRFLDRLRAPNAGAAAPFLERLFSGAGTLEIRENEPGSLVVETAPGLSLTTLLGRLQES
jgi:hypothetical protein